MNKFRIYTAAGLLCIGAIFISTPLTYATKKSAKDIALSACDDAYVKRLGWCGGSSMPSVRESCEKEAEAKHKSCVEKANKLSVRPPQTTVGTSSEPLLDKGPQTTRPNKLTPQTGKGGVTGNDAGTAKPGATTAPTSKVDAGQSKKPTPTPTPAKKY